MIIPWDTDNSSASRMLPESYAFQTPALEDSILIEMFKRWEINYGNDCMDVIH